MVDQRHLIGCVKDIRVHVADEGCSLSRGLEPRAFVSHTPASMIMKKPAGPMIDRELLDDEPPKDIHLAIILKANKPTIFIGPHMDAGWID